MASKENRRNTVSFSTIISLLLIISTVIVFTVLLFLSYESMLAKQMNNGKAEVDSTSYALCEAINTALLQSNDPSVVNEKDIENIETICHLVSKNFNGSIYLVADDMTIVLSENPDYDLELILQDVIAHNGEVQVTRLTEGKTYITSGYKVEQLNLWCISSSYIDRGLVFTEFRSVILIPAGIAVLFAIVLFVLAIQLTFAPVREMSKTIKKVSEGDYSVRVDKRYTDASDLRSITSAGDIVTMAATLNEMIDKLENSESDRQIFISSIANDIRTPLTSINGFVTAIMDGTIPPENVDKYLGLIKQEINRIRELVVSMTEASSLSHVDPDVMENFPLNEVITDVVDNLEPQLSEKNITCEVRLSDDPDANMCRGEAQQLCRVIVNIITNAIKFTPDNGKIIVSTVPNKAENRVEISVEDSGIGIPAEKRNRIFESFYKVDSSRTREGFGLGLYICKQILAGHGQTIYVDEGKELGGAKFIFAFPMAPDDKWDIV